MRTTPKDEVLIEGLGWPEGPTLLDDGRIGLVEAYGGRVAAVSLDDRTVTTVAHTHGVPNSVVAGAEGVLYVTQNGGWVGPWEAPVLRPPSIQRIDDGDVRVLVTEIDGVRLSGPNDLVFAPSGSLYFTDPGIPFREPPDRGRVMVLHPDGSGQVIADVGVDAFPNGIAVTAGGDIVWTESFSGMLRVHTPGSQGFTDLLHLPGPAPGADGLVATQDGLLFVAVNREDRVGLSVVDVAAGEQVDFIDCGSIPTNCLIVSGDLLLTDAGAAVTETSANSLGTLRRLPLGLVGVATTRGRIDMPDPTGLP